MIVSLLYHDVVERGQFDSSGFSGRDADIYKFERAEFERHLAMIEHAAGCGNVGILPAAATKKDSKVLIFTFDDGGASALSAAELLEGKGWRGHFFVTTNYIGQPRFLTAEQIRLLHSRGHVIGSHSCSHPLRMSYCSSAEIEHEWKESVRVLSECIGTQVISASIPAGYYSRRVAELAAASGIKFLFNSEPVSGAEGVGDCLVLGRYTIQQQVSATTAARIASGDWRPRFEQYVSWNSRKIAKRLGGTYYVALRKRLLNSGRNN